MNYHFYKQQTFDVSMYHKYILRHRSLTRKLFLVFIVFSINCALVFSQEATALIHYKVSVPEPASHTYEVELYSCNLNLDTIYLKMPKWMPGYYQIIDYAKSVENLKAKNQQGTNIPVRKLNDNTWIITGVKNKSFYVTYSIKTEKQFVANSYVDTEHAYLIPENTFLYIEGLLKTPVSISLILNNKWWKVATGLEPIPGKPNEFTASDFDTLYDCPILIGNLQELPSFKVKGVEHRFIGYKMENFDHKSFMNNLQKTIEAATTVFGDIPYKQYTFIGIGPGQGGIEHLNNTTISFDGTGLDKPEGMNKTMNFIAHEYIHHYNVKRIRPFELGPFDYDNGNKTNLLWVSEGLTVYYEYLIVKRAGLVNGNGLLSFLDRNINSVENNPGRHYQSLQQSSYRTWDEGPFGTFGVEPGKTISYYDKGPVVGLFLDFKIRNATENKKSLDDVMRTLYWKYYKKGQRGFTEAEFQETCEQIAGASLSDFFEYIYTTKELDYAKYLGYGGLKLNKKTIELKDNSNSQEFTINKIENPTPMQAAILKSWLGE